MSPQEREKWLQANTITCTEFGRIPPSQCEALRARPEKPGEAVCPPGKLPLLKPKACMSCQEWEELCVDAGKNETEDVMAKKIAPCKRCSLKRKVNARGLCASCYTTASKNGKLDKYPILDAAVHTPEKDVDRSDPPQEGLIPGPDTVVPLDFSDHPELLEAVRSRAQEQFRTLEMQIFWELSQQEARS